MTDEELADVILERLREFSPALTIRPLEGTPEERASTVVVEITMSRDPDPRLKPN